MILQNALKDSINDNCTDQVKNQLRIPIQQTNEKSHVQLKAGQTEKRTIQFRILDDFRTLMTKSSSFRKTISEYGEWAD